MAGIADAHPPAGGRLLRPPNLLHGLPKRAGRGGCASTTARNPDPVQSTRRLAKDLKFHILSLISYHFAYFSYFVYITYSALFQTLYFIMFWQLNSLFRL